MKVTARNADAFAKTPDPNATAILVYGPDGGLVRERAQALGKSVLDDLSDPFRVVELTGAQLRTDPTLLTDEAAAISFTGDRKLIRIRDVTDTHASVFKEFLDVSSAQNALVVIEGGEFGPRSKIRKLFETSDNAAALPCYADDARSLPDVIRSTLSEYGLQIDRDALTYLLQNLGSDRSITRSELHKLALYKGNNGNVTISDAMACIGDNAANSMDDVALNAASGNSPALDTALTRTFDEGNNPVAVLRACTRHFMRLHQAAGHMQDGMGPDQAIKALRPPVIFKVEKAFQQQVRAWTPNKLSRALDILVQAEMDCKTTGLPAEAVCARALLQISQAAKR